MHKYSDKKNLIYNPNLWHRMSVAEDGESERRWTIISEWFLFRHLVQLEIDHLDACIAWLSVIEIISLSYIFTIFTHLIDQIVANVLMNNEKTIESRRNAKQNQIESKSPSGKRTKKDLPPLKMNCFAIAFEWSWMKKKSLSFFHKMASAEKKNFSNWIFHQTK